MNQVIKFLFFSLSLVFFTTQMYAQPGRGSNMEPEELAQRQTDNMMETLALSDAQKDKIYEVNLKYANKMKVARDEAGEDRSQMREAMGAIRKEGEVELQKYLTTEQFETWQKIQMERRQKRGERGGRGGGKPGKEKKDQEGSKS